MLELDATYVDISELLLRSRASMRLTERRLDKSVMNAEAAGVADDSGNKFSGLTSFRAYYYAKAAAFSPEQADRGTCTTLPFVCLSPSSKDDVPPQ